MDPMISNDEQDDNIKPEVTQNDEANLTNPSSDADRVLLENGVIPDELQPDERQELLRDLTDESSADNDGLHGVVSPDERDGSA